MLQGRGVYCFVFRGGGGGVKGKETGKNERNRGKKVRERDLEMEGKVKNEWKGKSENYKGRANCWKDTFFFERGGLEEFKGFWDGENVKEKV